MSQRAADRRLRPAVRRQRIKEDLLFDESLASSGQESPEVKAYGNEGELFGGFGTKAAHECLIQAH